MGGLKHIWKWFFVTIFSLSVIGNDSFSQDIETAEEIMDAFRYDLKQSGANNDTLLVYEKYLNRLVNRGNYIHADSIFMQGKEGFEQIQDSSLLVNIYKARANMYKVQRRFEKSLQDYLWLTSYYEGKNSTQDLIEVYSLLAEYYRAIAKYDLSARHLNMAKSLFNTVEPTDRNLAYWYSRKAAWANEALNNHDSVTYYAKRGLSLASTTEDIYTRALLLNELGFNAMHISLPRDSVLSYLNESLTLLFQNERFRDYVDVVNNIGIYEYRFGDKQETIRLLESIIQLEKDNQWYSTLEVTYRYLTGAYRDLGNLAKAVEMSEWATDIVARNMTAEFNVKLNDLALNYEKGLAEKELQIQEQKTVTAQATAENNRKKFIISLITAIILLGLVVIAFRVSNQFKRKNEQLSQQQTKISEINQQLEKALSHQTTLYQELNHRVKNNLSILSGLIYLQQEEEHDDYTQKVLSVLRNRIKSLAFSHDNLYQNSGEEEVDFHQYLQEFLNELQVGLTGSKNITTLVRCEDLKLSLNQATPLAMVINELFTNSLKHGFKDQKSGTINICASLDGDTWSIKYEDNGYGFKQVDDKKGSLGLTLIELLMEQLDGTIENTESHKGVSFLMKIPHCKVTKQTPQTV